MPPPENGVTDRCHAPAPLGREARRATGQPPHLRAYRLGLAENRSAVEPQRSGGPAGEAQRVHGRAAGKRNEIYRSRIHRNGDRVLLYASKGHELNAKDMADSKPLTIGELESGLSAYASMRRLVADNAARNASAHHLAQSPASAMTSCPRYRSSLDLYRVTAGPPGRLPIDHD